VLVTPGGDRCADPAGGRAGDKVALRAELLAARRAMGASARAAAAAALTRSALELPELVSARCVAAYVSFGTEPSTTGVLGALLSGGVRVLLPVVRPDHDLDWAIYDDSGLVRRDRAGLWTPGSARLGVEAITQAEAVVVPALAVGRDGIRLGRGGGAYDRALARVPVATPVIALLYDGELRGDVPAEAHDRPVTLAVQPSGVHRFAPPDHIGSP
jgi:5-formyltetrahydrofolate cyclo-ligase